MRSNKITIGHIIYFAFLIQLLFFVARYYNMIDNIIILWLPTIILISVFIIAIFALLIMYKYIKNGRGKWFDSERGSDRKNNMGDSR